MLAVRGPAERLTRFRGYVGHHREGDEKTYQKSKNFRPSFSSHQLHPLSQGVANRLFMQQRLPLSGSVHDIMRAVLCQFVSWRPSGRLFSCGVELASNHIKKSQMGSSSKVYHCIMVIPTRCKTDVKTSLGQFGKVNLFVEVPRQADLLFPPSRPVKNHPAHPFMTCR